MIKSFGYFIFLRSTTTNTGPPTVSSLVDRMSINALSTISKTELLIHSQTSMMQPLKSRNGIGNFIPHYTGHMIYLIHHAWISLRNSLVDRCPRPAKTASVQQNNCLRWSERPSIISVFRKFPLPKYCSKHVSKFKTVLIIQLFMILKCSI